MWTNEVAERLKGAVGSFTVHQSGLEHSILCSRRRVCLSSPTTTEAASL